MQKKIYGSISRNYLPGMGEDVKCVHLSKMMIDGRQAVTINN